MFPARSIKYVGLLSFTNRNVVISTVGNTIIDQLVPKTRAKNRIKTNQTVFFSGKLANFKRAVSKKY